MIFPGRHIHRILVIQSYSKSMPTYSERDEKTKSQFQKNDINADIRVVYLDCERYSEKPEIIRINKLVKGATSDGWTPDIIITYNDQATYSLLKSGNPLTHRIPIVFAGVEYPNYQLLRQFDNVTGFVDKVDAMRNLELIKRIMGNSVAIYTPIDYSFLGKKVIKDIHEQLENQHVAGNFTTPQLTGEEIIGLNERHGYTIYDNYQIMDHTKLKNEDIRLIPQIRVFNRNFNKTKNGERYWLANMQLDGVAHLIYKYDKFSELLIETCPNPIFTASNMNFGSSPNVVGGYMTTIYMEVDDAVDIASKILNGEKIKDIPISQSSKEFAVNWDAIKKFHMNPGRLPSTCIIINRPFKEKYPMAWYLAIGSIAIMVILLIVLYYYEVRKRRRMNILIRQQHNILKSSLFAANAYAWEMKDGFITIDESFWINQGKEPRKISLDEFKEMMAPEQVHLLEDAINNLDKKGGGTLQMLLAPDKKEYRWWESRFFLAEGNKNRNAFYGLSFNIEATKRREKELEELKLLAEKAEMKQSFLENINHEIRTPLNAITGFSQILATDKTLSESEKKQYLSFVEKNNEKLLQIIDNILLISQLESGEIQLESKCMKVYDLINSICDKCEGMSNMNVNLIPDVQQECDCCILADRRYTETAIKHLVENALKLTEKGFVKVGYNYNSEKNEVEIFVEDTGCGIEINEHKLIFNQFYKHNRFGEGTGLGLTITKLIIEKQNGNIDFISEKGKGSRFSVIMPSFSETEQMQEL